jgi:predicted dehydrogenase
MKKGLNIYVEKPVTRNAQEAEAMADAVRESGAKLTVAHYRRGLPMFLHVKSLIDSGVIGDIRTVQIRMWKYQNPNPVADVGNWRYSPSFRAAGTFMTWPRTSST